MYAPPTPSPTDYATTPIWIDPSTSFLASFMLALMVALVVALVVESVREQRRAARQPCICGHGRLDHKGYQDRFECLLCRCRRYIPKV